MYQQKNKKTFMFLSSIIVSVGILFLCLPDISRAQGSVDEVIKTQGERVQALNNLIGVASWIWVIPSKLAGILMTNYFVYGTSFYLVDYLFKFRQIIRTFALYALGLYFVGYILYSWFKPEEAKSKIADLFKNTLIAGILISMSRWLIAATVDISVLFTSAVASIPSQIYEKEREKKKQCFDRPRQITVKTDNTIDTDKAGNPTNHTPPARKDISPEGDDMSGPLMFFGASVLKFFDMVYLPEQKIAGEGSTEWNKQRELSKTLIVVAVKAFLCLMLVIPMVMLMIVNLIRVVCLWLWIIFSPGIVLINVFGIKISDDLDKYLSPHNIFGLIMQPVAVVGMLSIGFIFIIELASIFNLCVQNPENSPLVVTPLSAGIDAPIGELASPIGTETGLGASLSALGDAVGGITGQLIMAIFVVILMWALIKIGFSFSELTRETTTSISDAVEGLAGTVPIVPLPGVGAIGLGALQNTAKQGFGLDKAHQSKVTNQENQLRKMIGLDSTANIGKLNTLADDNNTTLTELHQEVRKETEKAIIPTTNAKEIVKKWLQSASQTTQNQNLLKSIGLLTLSRQRDEEALSKLREGPEKDKAYRLLNRLFNSTGKGMATDATFDKIQYGLRGKK